MTDTQRAALEFMERLPNGEVFWYTLKVNRSGNGGTLRQLASRNLVEPVGPHSLFPKNYRITDAGRAALARLATKNEPEGGR